MAGEGGPFFLFLAYRAPHAPVQAPKELVDKYLPRFADFHQVAANRHAGRKKCGIVDYSQIYKRDKGE